MEASAAEEVASAEVSAEEALAVAVPRQAGKFNNRKQT